LNALVNTFTGLKPLCSFEPRICLDYCVNKSSTGCTDSPYADQTQGPGKDN